MDKHAEFERFLAEGLADGLPYLPEPMTRIDDLLCGCGEPWRVWEWIAARLEQVMVEWWDSPNSGAEWFALYALDRKGLVEHGGSLPHCWLTDDGMVMLGFLLVRGTDWQQQGQWIGADGVTRGITI